MIETRPGRTSANIAEAKKGRAVALAGLFPPPQGSLLQPGDERDMLRRFNSFLNDRQNLGHVAGQKSRPVEPETGE